MNRKKDKSRMSINLVKISEIETPFGKRILIKKRKIKEQMKIILAQNFEILRQDDFHLFLDFSFLKPCYC